MNFRSTPFSFFVIAGPLLLAATFRHGGAVVATPVQLSSSNNGAIQSGSSLGIGQKKGRRHNRNQRGRQLKRKNEGEKGDKENKDDKDKGDEENKNDKDQGDEENKNNKDQGDEDTSCLDDSNVFRSCVRRRRHLLDYDTASTSRSPRRSFRQLKKNDKRNTPGDPDFIMTDRITFTLGAAVDSLLSDGCDCRLDVEVTLAEYLSKQFDDKDFSINCAAIVVFDERPLGQAGGPSTVTDVQVELTMEFDDDFEEEVSTGTCDGSQWLRCCIARELPAEASVDFSCQACPMNMCPETDVAEKNLQDFLTKKVKDCEDSDGEDAVFLQLPPPLAGPTPSPTPGIPADTTRAPTVSPTMGGMTEGPTPGLPAALTKAPLPFGVSAPPVNRMSLSP